MTVVSDDSFLVDLDHISEWIPRWYDQALDCKKVSYFLLVKDKGDTNSKKLDILQGILRKSYAGIKWCMNRRYIVSK